MSNELDQVARAVSAYARIHPGRLVAITVQWQGVLTRNAIEEALTSRLEALGLTSVAVQALPRRGAGSRTRVELVAVEYERPPSAAR